MTTTSVLERIIVGALRFVRRAKARIGVALHQHFTQQGSRKNAQHENHNPIQHLSLSLVFVGFVGSSYSKEGAI